MLDFQKQINAILNGDVNAFELLIQRFQKPVFKFLIGMGIPKDQIEDLAQDVFLAVYQNLESFDDQKSQLATWIFSIAKNKAINFMRLKKMKSFFGFHNETLESEKSDSDLELRLQNQDQQKLIWLALQTLSVEQKSVLMLFYYSELSIEEIAVIEKCSVGTVKSRLHRLKSELKTKLDQEAL